MNRNRIIAEVSCPATSRTYDFIIYTQMTVCQAIENISRQIMDYEGNDIMFDDISSLDLFSSEFSLPLDKHMLISECNIRSGSRLMLV